MAKTAAEELASSVYDWRRVYEDGNNYGVWADDADGGRLAVVVGSHSARPHETGRGPLYVDTGRVPCLVTGDVIVPVDVLGHKSTTRVDIDTALAAGFRVFEIVFGGAVVTVEVRDAKRV